MFIYQLEILFSMIMILKKIALMFIRLDNEKEAEKWVYKMAGITINK